MNIDLDYVDWYTEVNVRSKNKVEVKFTGVVDADTFLELTEYMHGRPAFKAEKATLVFKEGK